MKRMTETQKWDDRWFRELSPALKCFWLYLCDRCDAAGVWELDLKGAAFAIGEEIPLANLWATFGERLEKVHGGTEEKWRIVKFVRFQFPKLSRDCPPHKSVFLAMEKHGLDEVAVRTGVFSSKVADTLPKGKGKVPQTLQEKEEEEDTDKEEEKEKAAPKPRERNEMMDALASATGINPLEITRQTGARLNKVLTALKEATPDVTPAEITNRVQTYRRLHPDWTYTPEAIQKHWPTLNGAASDPTFIPAHLRHLRP